MRLHKLLTVMILVIITVACQCVGPTYLFDLFKGSATPTPAATSYLTTVTKTAATAAVPTAAAMPSAAIASTTALSPTQLTISETHDYDVIETIELTNEGPETVNQIVIWVALIQTILPYQVLDFSSISAEDYEIITDEFGNRFAEIELHDIPVGEVHSLEFTFHVSVNAFEYSPKPCIGSTIETFLEPEEYIESDASLITDLAGTLQQGHSNKCETARAIYDYIGDDFTYSEYTAEDIGALQALEDGSGDCTEFSDLFIALSRASGIPANFVEGVTCCTSNGFEAGSVQHDWSEIYLPGNGWVPVDATFGRFPNKREQYFAEMTPDHIIITRGRNLETLDGYHFYYYRYWWDGLDTEVSSFETWSIMNAEE